MNARTPLSIVSVGAYEVQNDVVDGNWAGGGGGRKRSTHACKR
jgi:hypothetical protein